MKVTLDFCQAFGSGIDPDDFVCEQGFYFIKNQLEKNNGSCSLSYLQQAALEAMNNGSVEEMFVRSWMIWAEKLKKNPFAISYWNNEVYLELYKIKYGEKSYIVNSFQEAIDKKKQVLDEAIENIFQRLNVLKCRNNNNSMTTISISSYEEITEGFTYKVLNEETGIFTDCDTVEDALNQIYLSKQILTETIKQEIKTYQKIKDPEEGFEAWKEIANEIS